MEDHLFPPLPQLPFTDLDNGPSKVLVHDSRMGWLLTDNFSDDSPIWRKVMYAILGNKKQQVKPWWMPFDWVFARTMNSNYQMKVIVIRNRVAPNVYGLPVIVENHKVLMIVRSAQKIDLT